jgi:SAM-dependent methyltransferase
VSQDDRIRWDDRYTGAGPAPVGAVGVPAVFAEHENVFPTGGHALDLGCGQGAAAVWLARRGMNVRGLDVSSVAADQARNLARGSGVDDRCRFDVADLDHGLPGGPPADVIVCHKFRDRRLDGPIVERLAPGGLLAITALSEVDAGPGRFRVAPGELCAAFSGLDPITAGESGGRAWLLARARS